MVIGQSTLSIHTYRGERDMNLEEVDMTDVEVISTDNIDINEYFRVKLIENLKKEENSLHLY